MSDTLRISTTGQLSFEGSSALSEFAEKVHLVGLASPDAARKEAARIKTAVKHLAAFLERSPRVEDLTAATLAGCNTYLVERGRAIGTCDRYCESLKRIAKTAFAAGILECLPRTKRLRPAYKGSRATPPWSIDELTRLYGSARTMPGEISGLPAALFWPALILSVLDSQVSAPSLLMLAPEAFNPQARTLAAGMFVYSLRSRTCAAISALTAASGPEATRLFPWSLDAGHPPFFMLYYHFRNLLDRADLPTGQQDLLDRLRATAAADPDVLESIDLDCHFAPRELPIRQPRRREPAKPLTRPPVRAAYPIGFTRKRPLSSKGPKSAAPTLYRIAPSPDRAHRKLQTFFSEIYKPRRLDDGAPDTAIAYLSAIDRLCEFAACEVLLEQLSDNLIECFLGYRALAGDRPHTRKKLRAELLSIWRFAARKRDPRTGKPFVDEPPLDIDAVKVPKIEPECWSQSEVAKLLDVAAATEGTVSGIPAAVYWPALILVLYDTGLRIKALMQLRVADCDLAAGWVKARFDTQKQLADQSLGIYPETCRFLAATKPEERDLLFPFPFKGKHALVNRLRVLLQRAGLPSTKRDLFHKLRRTCATYVADVAGEQAAMRQMGHSTIQVTRMYIDKRKLSAPRVVDQMKRPEWASPFRADDVDQAGLTPAAIRVREARPLRLEGPAQ